MPRARGAELGVGGWYFTGREQAVRELAAWLRRANSGGAARVVTGGAGCGKSAVLARIVTLSDPAYREEVLVARGSELLDPDGLPPEGVVSVAVHARRKLVGDVVAHIARGLSLSAREPAELVERLAHRLVKTAIVIDALDEADEQAQIVSTLLRPLAGLAHVFLLVGTRPDSAEHGRRFRALGQSAVEIDLDEPRYIGVDDVARYVERRLLATEEPGRATPYRQSPETTRMVAEAVAGQAKNVFLVAHTAVLALLARPSVVDVSEAGWIDHLPTGLDQAFVQFLDELDTRQPSVASSTMARRALLPLAFAEGEGLPWLNLWASVATAISNVPVDDEEITIVRNKAAAFIVEALENDRSVYRLYHERIAEHLRNSVDAAQTQRRIVGALRASVPVVFGTREPDWSRAHPYVLTHLVSHAVHAGEIGELLADGNFLASAEPVRVLEAFAQATDSFARRAYNSYRLAFGDLRDQRVEDRLSYLEMAARKLDDDVMADAWVKRRGAHRWRVPWARWSPVMAHRVISGHEGRVYAVAVGEREGRAVIISGSGDGTVRVWDLTNGRPLGEPLRGHKKRRGDDPGEVYAVAVGQREGRAVIVSGGGDGTVRVWDLTDGRPLGEPLRGHKERWGDDPGEVYAVAVGEREGRGVIVSGGGDGTVRVWDLVDGRPVGTPLQGHEDWVYAVALGERNGRAVIVSGGRDGTVRVWDLVDGRPIGEPLRGRDRVDSVAVTERAGRPVIVSIRGDGMVNVWDLDSLQPAGEPLGESLSGTKSWCGSSVVVGQQDGRPVIVSGAMDGSVRVWDLNDGRPLGQPLRGHQGEIFSVAMGHSQGRSVIVSGGDDGTVRVWDMPDVRLEDPAEPVRKSGVLSVAMVEREGHPVIIAGRDDGTVRQMNVADGRPAPEPLSRHTGPVTSVAVGEWNGRVVIAFGGQDTVRVWDLAGGGPVGEPLRAPYFRVGSIAIGRGRRSPPVIVVSGGERNLGQVRVWDLARDPLRSYPLWGFRGEGSSVAAWEREGRAVIVCGGWDGTVRVWDLADDRPAGEPLQGHTGRVHAVAVGEWEARTMIVSGGDDGTVRVWDMDARRLIGEPLRHKGEVSSVAVGEWRGRTVIVSGGSDGKVRVWRTAGQLEIAVNVGAPVLEVTFASGARIIVRTTMGLMLLTLE